MGDDGSQVYGLETHARALAALPSDVDAPLFLVGTQSLRASNQVHLLEYEEDTNSISASIYSHPPGEVWQLATSASHETIFASLYNVVSESKAEGAAAVWQLPEDGDALEMKIKISLPEEPRHLVWSPEESSHLLAATCHQSVCVYDVTVERIAATLSASAMKVSSKFSSAAWNPHQGASQLAVLVETSVRAFDWRSGTAAWCVEGAHQQLVRCLDFNPNRQYYLATGGDDCLVKFWDIRAPGEPVAVSSEHQHWVWSLQYNSSHDQLLLSSSSDARVHLLHYPSISYQRSEAELSDNESDDGREALAEGVLRVYDEHEDSVYSAVWSAADAWLFASLSYDGRLLLNRLPRNVKYSILL